MKRIAAFVICVSILFALVGCGSTAGTQKPFKNLKSSDIETATVRLLPPGTTIQIDETDKLVRLLRKVVMAERSAPDTDTLSGQLVIYELDLSDGSHKEIQVYYPYIVIDGISYKAEYRPCEALNSYANTLMEKYQDS